MRPGGMVVWFVSLAASMVAWDAAAAGLGDQNIAKGVADFQRAQRNYMLNCQGCHRPDGSGSRTTAPALAGTIAKFTWTTEGRAYVGRVPGVASAALSDGDLAELLNWTLWRFDAAHVPKTFRPYGAAEIGTLRRDPLRSNAAAVRAGLVVAMAKQR